MTELILSRLYVPNLETRTPEMGAVKADYEFVTGIRTPDAHASFSYDMGTHAEEARSLKDVRQTVSPYMARRLFNFCELTFCAGNADYDCHSFTGFVMGWQDSTAAGSARIKQKWHATRDFEGIKNNVAYVARAPGALAPNAHSFIGTERPGYALSAMGPGLPMVLSSVRDLRRTFGATQLSVRTR